jgi:exopolyphosphatase / guanosine-5'-triphosphate,3'-diphosphate pyrophosphatase
VRIAIVDIGTNSTRLLVGRVEGDLVVEELERLTAVTRLGAGVDATGRLGSEAMQRVYEALEGYRGRIDAHRPVEAHAVLTSAVRDASNGEEFAHQVADRYQLNTHVLDGEREALLTYRGAISGRVDYAPRGPVGDASLGRLLVIDIGGGSTELVLGSRRAIAFHVSTNAGVVRQSERHIKRDPPSEAELQAVADDVRGILEVAVPPARRAGVALAIAVAGTPTSLAAIAQRLEPYDPQRTHGYRLTAAERDSILRSLAAMTLQQRQSVPGLQPARAGVIVPGIVILREVMGLFSLDSVEVSEHDILHGAMLAVAGGEL